MNLQYTIIDKVTGAIRRTGTCPDIVYQYQCQSDELIIDGCFSDALFYYDLVNQTMVSIPSQPTTFHRWDSIDKTWKDTRTVDRVRTEKLQAIEIEREARINAPILIGAVLVDADEKSQRNITNKLSEIQDLQSLSLPGLEPEECVWRLADDSMLTFANESEYQTWLIQLAIAIRKRGTQAYLWSWTKKGQLHALGDNLEALIDFDSASD